MLTGIAAWVAAHVGFGAIAGILGGGSGLSFVGAGLLKSPGLRKAVVFLAIVLGIVAATLIGVGVIHHKIKVYGDERAAAARAATDAQWQSVYSAAMRDMNAKLSAALADLSERDRALAKTEDKLNAERQENDVALRGALTGDAGGVIVPESVLSVFRRAARQDAGH